ncbi:MAG TPA: metallophosphoesterase [Syntrophorhabdaceae bacterium]|nr:metallophosphoesterase [Syntrophorhabdaceae bacterium]
MSIFFITFFTLYSVLHAYVMLKAWYAFRFRFSTGCVIAAVFLIFLFAPVIVRFLENGGHETTARLAAYAGYIWMGAVFFFFAVSLTLDIVRFFVYIFSLVIRSGMPGFFHSNLLFFLLPLAASVFVTAYGFFEAQNVRTERIRIETNKLPAGIERLTIVQVSDVHLGLVIREDRLKKIVQAIREANPQILVSTGDLVDGQINDLNGLYEMLGGIKPRYGKFAIMGNHEFYAGTDVSLDFTQKAGFRMLRGESVTIDEMINIAGVDDIVSGRHGNDTYRQERAALSGLSPGLFTVLLKHRPVVDPASARIFDLQLSGHTHNGQIFPFTYLTRIAFPMYAGLHKLDAGPLLYVSRGSGTWGPPIRFLSPPEVTVIEIVRTP